jgi:excisionase family DNA binding protein
MPTVSPSTLEPDTLTLYDLARLWGVSYTTVYEQARLNKLPVPVFRVGRRYLVSRKAYEEVMRKHHAPEPLDAA